MRTDKHNGLKIPYLLKMKAPLLLIFILISRWTILIRPFILFRKKWLIVHMEGLYEKKDSPGEYLPMLRRDWAGGPGWGGLR